MSNIRSFSQSEAMTIIEKVINTNRYNTKHGIANRVSLELQGVAGIGKTSMVQQVGKKLELPVVKINVAQLEEVGDLVGFGIKKYEVAKDDKTKWVAEKALLSNIKQGWHVTDTEPVMGYAIPEWIANKGDSGILLLDDYSRADQRLLQAIMEITDRGEYISWKLPSDWHVILTSNPDDGEYIVNTMDDAQRTRFFSINVTFDRDSWAEWATNNNVNYRYIDFLYLNPQVINDGMSKDSKNLPNPRVWTRFFHSIGHLKEYESKTAVQDLDMFGNISVGSSLATTFAQYLKNKLYELPDMEKVLTKQNIQENIDKIDKVVNKDDNYRADIASVLCTRMVAFTTYALENKKIKDRETFFNNIKEVITSKVLGVDVSYAVVNTLMQRHRQQLSAVLTDPEVSKFVLA